MTKKKIGRDKKVSELKRRRVKGIPIIKHGTPQPGITKKEFMGLLEKASQPAEREEQSDSENSET